MDLGGDPEVRERLKRDRESLKGVLQRLTRERVVALTVPPLTLLQAHGVYLKITGYREEEGPVVPNAGGDMGPWCSLENTPACGAGDPGFESRRAR